MDKIKQIHSTAVPMPIENIDTDQIIPARFLKATDMIGFGNNLFFDWRYDENGNKNNDFVLNNPEFKGEILVAGHNFGCGSSREHATWALKGYGFKVIISSFFADIFKNNALNIGLVPIEVSEDELRDILHVIQKDPNTILDINIENQTIQYHQHTLSFPLDAYKKTCLINGYDDIDYLVNIKSEIQKFEKLKLYP